MALLEVNWKPNQRELRQFSLAWTVFFGLIGAYSLWALDAPVAASTFWIVAAVGVGGWLRPRAIRPAYLVMMALALPIGWVVSRLLLVVVYYLVLTPIGLVLRLFGYDPLCRKMDGSATSYWAEHKSTDDPAQYFKQY
jgi:hypothetical protein